MKCDKCKEDASEGTFSTSGDKVYRLCKHCTDFLANHKQFTLMDFMGPSCQGKVFENIRKAAKLRNQGKGPWIPKPM